MSRTPGTHDEESGMSTTPGIPGLAEGGEPACWAHLVCPECGSLEGEDHHAGCIAEHNARRPDAAPEHHLVVRDASTDHTSAP